MGDVQVPGAADDPAEVDVLVVGCGPTGLALAAELRAWDVRFRVVDRSLDRVHESRALAIQARTLEVLARHGVTDRLLALGSRTVELHLHAGRRRTRAPLFDIGASDTAYPFLLFLSQATTEQVLTDHLADRGVTCERGTELVGLVPGPDGVLCRLRSRDGAEESVLARYVVGCDGAHSAVRRLAGIPFEGAAYPQSFVLADVEAEGLSPGAAHAFLAASGILFFFPLGSPASWRVLGMRSPDTAAAAPVDLADVQALADAYTGGAVRLHDPVWMTDFRLHNRGAARYRAGRVLLAGDAAHIHSPAGGQGMNTGIQDAVNLGWKLALVTAGRAGSALLDTYEAERAPVGRLVLRFTDRAFTVATSDALLPRLGRTQLAPRAIPVVLGWRRGRAIAFRTISELGISSGAARSRSASRACVGAGPGRATGSPTPRCSWTARVSRCTELSRDVASTCCCAGTVDGGPSPPGAPWRRGRKT